jgi:hypothetical protein
LKGNNVETQPTPESEENPRKNRARDRHQRRKERSSGMVYPTNAPRSQPRQIRPTGSFQIPKIQLPTGSNRLILYGIAAAAFIVLVIFALGRLKNNNNTPDIEPNAIWLGTQWTYDNPDDAALSTLVQRFNDNHIGTAYAFVSLLQPDGSWTDTNKLDSVKAFADRFKKLMPKVQLYGWLSIGSQGVDGNNRLGDAGVQQNISDFSQRMIDDFDFNGVFLNVVPVINGDESYLSLLRKVRATIGENADLAVAVPPDWTPTDAGIAVPKQIEPGTIWDESYKQRVALLADQIFVAAYNAGFDNPDDYSAWIAYQVKTYAQAIADLATTTELIIGVPTYDAAPPDHDPAIENAQSAIKGITAGLSQAGAAAQFVRGIGIYAEWETTADEWNQIKTLWIDR